MPRPTGSPKYGTTRKNTQLYYTTKRLIRYIYYSNKRQETSLISYDNRAFSVGNMTLLINLKKAEHPKIYIAAREENNRLESVCFVAPGRTASKILNGVVLGMCSMKCL